VLAVEGTTGDAGATARTAEVDGALVGHRVVVCGGGLATGFAAKLAADLGADVILLEPGSGSPLRSRPPLGPTGSGLWFAHLAAGWRSVRVDRVDDPILPGLLADTDVLLVDDDHPLATSLAAGVAERTVVVDVSPWGRSGPWAGAPASDLSVWAMGGYLGITGAPDREPLWLPGGQASLHAGAHALFAAQVGLWERRASGRGQHVEVAELDAVLAAHAWLVSSWAGCGEVMERVPSDLIDAADGRFYLMRIVPNDAIFTLIERPDLAAEDLTRDIPTWFANIPRIFDAIARWAADRPVAEIVERGQLLRIAVTPVVTPTGVLEDPQLAFRSWWETDPVDGDAPALRFPGQPYRLTAGRSQRRGRAPTVGEHDAAVRAETAAAVGSATVAAGGAAGGGTSAGGPGPLAGLRVVEVTQNWAGPLCGRYLADLGADVVKVERAERPATRALYWAGPTKDFQRQPHHRSLYFAEMNRNKRDVCIDLAVPDGRQVLLDLVRTADVLIENNSARVMGNLGLDWPALSAVNPRLVMLSMSGYGADGPRRDWLAYGANIETTSALTSVTGYPDGQVSRTTLFYADPTSGILGANAVLAALAHRDRTGVGQWVEMSLNEVGATFCTEALLLAEHTGVERPPMGNRDPAVATQGVHPCAGTDHWVAISCTTTAQWQALARLVGRDDLAVDPGLVDLTGRAERHDEIDDAVSAWTRTLEQYEVTEACHAVGVAAAPVLRNWQILADLHIHERGIYASQRQHVVGYYPATTWPWRFARTPASLRGPAPRFGEHNREVFAALGYDATRVADLYERGVTADEPT